MSEGENRKITLLKRYFGHDSFRQGQETLIDSLLSGRDVIGIMPTGAGKSICYQLPALMLNGVTIVISPLISLMKDQVNSLIQAGVPTAYINSSLTPVQSETAVERALQGAYKLIYVAPERLDTPSFQRLTGSGLDIAMIAVDEAHCVSQWGQDFRPSYLKIAEFAESLKKRPVMAAFTATATDAVKQDIERLLGLHDPKSLVTGFDRQNLYFSVIDTRDKLGETERLVRSYEGQSGIIYCATRKNTELVCDTLNDLGIPCTRYHAGLSDEERRKNQDDFLYDRVRVMAATNAFGMGIDKSNVSFVIHYNMPKNIESYYQEAGRAGRDGSEAFCTLLFSRQDVNTNRYLIENSGENSELDPEQAEQLKRRDYKRLRIMTEYCTTTDCLRHYILDYFGEDSPTACAKCSNCAADYTVEDVTLEAQKVLSCIYRMGQKRLKMGEKFIADVLHGSKSKRVQQFGCDTLSTYGIMSDVPMVRIRAVIVGLCDKGYIRRDDRDCLILTIKARELLFDDGRFSMSFKKSVSKDKGRSLRAEKKLRGAAAGTDPELFDRLRKVRAEYAEAAQVPAYIIFSDASLHDMAAKLPTDYTAFLTVSGVGQSKAERYGEKFTAAIREYIEENPEAAREQDEGEAALSRRRRSLPEEEQAGGSSYLPAMQSNADVNSVAQTLSERCGVSFEQAKEQIELFLTENGYITGSVADPTVTPRGGISGIALSTKVTESGRVTVLELKRKAQAMIYAEFADELKKAASERTSAAEKKPLAAVITKAEPQVFTIERMAVTAANKLGCRFDEARERIEEFLGEKHYLIDADGEQAITVSGAQQGLSFSHSVTAEGRKTVVELDRRAQRMILEELCGDTVG